MMIKYKIPFIILIFFHLQTVLFGQDPSFSGFYQNRTYYNPAYTGFHKGSNMVATYRRLWPQLPAKLTTCFASFDANMEEIKGFGGLGVSVLSDVEGPGRLSTQNVTLNMSSLLFKQDYFFMAVGLGPSIGIKAIDTRDLVFSDQFDEYYGQVYPSSYAFRGRMNTTYFDMSTGVLAQYLSNPKHGPFEHYILLTAGAALQHALKPSISFYNTASDLPRKFTVHADVEFPVIWNLNKVYLGPGFVYEQQSDMQTVMIGFDTRYSYFSLSTWYRRYTGSDALLLGFTVFIPSGKNQLNLSYIYDATLSDLRSSTGGSHEISLSYHIDKSLLYSLGIVRKYKNYACPRDKYIKYSDYQAK